MTPEGPTTNDMKKITIEIVAPRVPAMHRMTDEEFLSELRKMAQEMTDTLGEGSRCEVKMEDCP